MKGTHHKLDHERRRHARVKVVANCHVYVDQEHFIGTLVDISVGGVCVEADIRITEQDHSESLFAAGSPITVDIPQLKLSRLTGTAIRVDSAGLGYVVAMKFDAVRSDVAIRLIDRLSRGNK